VWVKLLDGSLNAKRLEIADKGDVLLFTDVTMVLQSGGQNGQGGHPGQGGEGGQAAQDPKAGQP
jgi:hypothetical protein